MTDQQAFTIAVLSSSQDDVELVNKTLRDAGHHAHCVWVRNPAALEDCLQSRQLELLILNRDRYPDSVHQVVKLKDGYHPEVPALAMQFDVDETNILDAMQQGASDLVSTRNVDRLKAVVSRELRTCRIERALNSTLQSATTYRKQLYDYMEGSASPIAYIQEGIITDANRAWLDLFGAGDKSDVIGLPLMDNFEAESRAAVKGAIVATMRDKWQPGEKLKANTRLANNRVEELELAFQLAKFDDGDRVQLRITPPAPAKEEPTRLVHDALQRDPTTLFFHRAQLIERITRRLATKPKSGLHVLVYIKPDDFSTVAERVGLLGSEEILAQLSEVIRKRLHPRDVAGRFEGTVVMALLERGSDDDAEVWAQQLVDKINGTEFEVGGNKTPVTCTVGVCPVSGVYENMEELVTAAADACRAGRRSGGNCVSLNDALDVDTKQRRHDRIWVKRIRAALMDNRFRLAQLPIAGLKNDSARMVDTLVRMLDERGEAVLPSEFLPAAERNNLLKTIDRWMIGAALDYAHAENADRVFVRLSTQSLRDASLTEWLQVKITEHGVTQGRLCLQIAEKEAARHIREACRLTEALRRLGVAFAIEHYGVTRGHFEILDRLKPVYIKIDGELMHSLMSDLSLQQQVRQVVTEAENRGIATIAERVENANAMAMLFQFGIHYMQGHYVHEPEVVLQERVNRLHTSLEAIASDSTGQFQSAPAAHDA